MSARPHIAAPMADWLVRQLDSICDEDRLLRETVAEAAPHADPQTTLAVAAIAALAERLTEHDAIVLLDALAEAIEWRPRLHEALPDLPRTMWTAVLDLREQLRDGDAQARQCPECEGSGLMRYSETRDCPACWGSGERLA